MVRNTSTRNVLATAYGTDNPYGGLATGDPGTSDSIANEVTGGSYARKAMTWGTAASGIITSAATVFDVPSGVTVSYFFVASTNVTSAATVGDSVDVTDQTFASAGTYTVTATYTQS